MISFSTFLSFISFSTSLFYLFLNLSFFYLFLNLSLSLSLSISIYLILNHIISLSNYFFTTFSFFYLLLNHILSLHLYLFQPHSFCCSTDIIFLATFNQSDPHSPQHNHSLSRSPESKQLTFQVTLDKKTRTVI